MANKKTKGAQYYEAVGRRKTAVARVRLYIAQKDKPLTVGGTTITGGQIVVNKKSSEKVFTSNVDKAYYVMPLKVTGNEGRFAISVKVSGGGKQSQLEAVTHGIARALEKVDKDAYRPLLKTNGLLTRDPRIRERRKVGTGGKARRQKQSPKR